MRTGSVIIYWILTQGWKKCLTQDLERRIKGVAFDMATHYPISSRQHVLPCWRTVAVRVVTVYHTHGSIWTNTPARIFQIVFYCWNCIEKMTCLLQAFLSEYDQVAWILWYLRASHTLILPCKNKELSGQIHFAPPGTCTQNGWHPRFSHLFFTEIYTEKLSIYKSFQCKMYYLWLKFVHLEGFYFFKLYLLVWSYLFWWIFWRLSAWADRSVWSGWHRVQTYPSEPHRLSLEIPSIAATRTHRWQMGCSSLEDI